jgi:hypothetical protein
MGKMVLGGILLVGFFGLSFTSWSLAAFLVGLAGAVLFFWGFLKIWKPRKKKG